MQSYSLPIVFNFQAFIYAGWVEVGYLRRPPKIKVLEAAGAIADGRIHQLSEYWFKVKSSEGDRVYSVYVNIDSGEACSTDNGTKYRGYVGYPIISILMIKGLLPYRKDVGKALSGIDWKALNEKFKKYAIVEEEVKKIAVERGVSEDIVEEFKNEVYSHLKTLRIKSVSNCFKKIT